MCSTHFRRETHVGAYNVILYPRRPRWVNVIAYPRFAGSVFRPGRFNPMVLVLAGGNNPEEGRFANPLAAFPSSDCARINNSNGIGYNQYPAMGGERRGGREDLAINTIRLPFIDDLDLDDDK